MTTWSFFAFFSSFRWSALSDTSIVWWPNIFSFWHFVWWIWPSLTEFDNLNDYKTLDQTFSSFEHVCNRLATQFNIKLFFTKKCWIMLDRSPNNFRFDRALTENTIEQCLQLEVRMDYGFVIHVMPGFICFLCWTRYNFSHNNDFFVTETIL